MNSDPGFRLQRDRAIPRWGLLALVVLALFCAAAYLLIARSPNVTLTAQGDASSGDRAYVVDVKARSAAEQIDLPRLRAHIRLRDGRGQFRIRAEELPGDKGAVTYVLREPWYRPDQRGETRIAVLAAEAPRGSSPAPSPKEPPASDEWGSAPSAVPSAGTQPPAGAAAVVPPSPPEAAPPATAPPAAAPPTATQPPAQAPLAAPSAAPPPTLAQPTTQAPAAAPPAAAPAEPPATSLPPASPSPQTESEAPTTTSPPGEAAPSEEEPTESAPAEADEPPAPPRSAWARDSALESELAGRGVTGVTILRNGRSIRLRGTVPSDAALRALYQFMNDKGFGEVSYGVEVR